MLREEKSIRMPGGLYHELQVRMTYNSNHIEGSRLSEDQTRRSFETNTIDAGEGIPVDDIIETVNHFRAVDFCIDVAEAPITEEIIKELHRILKQGMPPFHGLPLGITKNGRIWSAAMKRQNRRR